MQNYRDKLMQNYRNKSIWLSGKRISPLLAAPNSVYFLSRLLELNLTVFLTFEHARMNTHRATSFYTSPCLTLYSSPVTNFFALRLVSCCLIRQCFTCVPSRMENTKQIRYERYVRVHLSAWAQDKHSYPKFLPTFFLSFIPPSLLHSYRLL